MQPASNDENKQLSGALDRLRQAGFKMTQRRQEILEIFIQEDKYLKAAFIHQLLAKKYPTMSHNTVYRNLYDFVEVGILETTEFNQEQWFKFRCPGAHHHHHFICTKCGKAIVLEACPMDHILTDLSDVEIQSHRFEIFGLCADCLKQR